MRSPRSRRPSYDGGHSSINRCPQHHLPNIGRYHAIPHDRAAGATLEKQQAVLRNHPEKKALASLLLSERAAAEALLPLSFSGASAGARGAPPAKRRPSLASSVPEKKEIAISINFKLCAEIVISAISAISELQRRSATWADDGGHSLTQAAPLNLP